MQTVAFATASPKPKNHRSVRRHYLLIRSGGDDEEPGSLGIVVLDGCNVPVMWFEHLAKRGGLAVAEFEHELAAGAEVAGGLAGEQFVEAQAVGAAIEGAGGVEITDFGVEGGDFGGGDVGRVADDQVEGGGRRQGRKGVAMEELEAVGDLVAGGVGAGDFEGGCGNIEGGEPGGGTFQGEGDGEAAGAGTEVEGGGGRGAGGEEGPAGLGEKFGFGPGDEDVAVDGHFVAAKAGGAGDVLEGFAEAAALDEFTKLAGFAGGENALEVEVQFHAGELQEMGEEQLGLQARGLDAFFGEEIGAFLDGFEDGHGSRLRGEGERGKHQTPTSKLQSRAPPGGGWYYSIRR